MAREREVAGQFPEAVAMGVTRDVVERLARVATGEQIENSEPLFRARRRVEPRYEAFITGVRLTDAKPVFTHSLAVVPSVPDELQVVGFVLRIEKLVRCRKHRERSLASARDNRASRHRQRLSRRLGIEPHALELSAG